MSMAAEEIARVEHVVGSLADENDVDALAFFDRKVDSRLAINSPFLHKMQVRHFVLSQIAPMVLTTGAVVLAVFVRVTWLDLSVFAVMWLLTGLGISAGYHRPLCHRSFKAAQPLRIALNCVASSGAAR
jgi:stearoyl-CoA desaturase (delta-9 desaturase)